MYELGTDANVAQSEFERVGITEDTVDPTTVLAQRAIQKVGAKVKKEYLIA
jgi:hypothetical protein